MSDPLPNSRNIPLPMQRAIRQRCGFGCVMCGLPLYEYDHIEGWGNAKEHVEEQITLLCDQHHKEKTNGLLPIDKVRKANSDPNNLRKGVTKPYDLHFAGEKAEVFIGGCSFTHPTNEYGTFLIPLEIDGTPIIGFIVGDGHVLLNLVVFDEFNNQVLHIKNNQLVLKPDVWDIQLVGQCLTIREAHRKILMDILFEPPNRITIARRRFLRNGVEVIVRPTNLLVTNNRGVISGMTARANRGIVLGAYEKPPPCAMYLGGIPRYLGDNAEALKFERECRKEWETRS